jgi:hypothetical protein
MPSFALSEQWLVDKLEEIAQDDRNRAAQLSAIKELKVIRGMGREEPAPNPVAGLYDVANPGRVRSKKAG